MSHPCQYKVFKRVKGKTRKEMVASFAERADAVIWAIQASKGRYNYVDIDVVVYNHNGRVYCRFHRGAEA